MGNTCCQDANIKHDISDSLQGRVSLRNFSNEFYECDMPADPQLLELISTIRQDQTFALVLNSHKLMKNKFLDKYYQGKWNTQGEPQGLGLMFQPDHYLYHGQFKIVPSGTGTLYLHKEGLTYQGELRAGRAEGHGRLRSNDGRIYFQGQMLNSMPRSGQLRIINSADLTKSYTVTLQNFPEGASKIVYGDGRIYEGAVSRRSFAPQGKGRAYFSDGSSYEGDWQQGEMHGKGIFRWKDGTSYEGDYQHGRKHGEGTFLFLTQKRYSGQWAAGKQHGHGRLFDQSGKLSRQGVWREGVFERQERSQ